ncbi:MAG: PorV/PorQ family protein [Bacteroidetes bacterium]|nr:PorV/PorQ family protein [Bacteroidota bacterium]MCH8326712.1 PorV/PorQ family protein [Bacteroidota bacterium]
MKSLIKLVILIIFLGVLPKGIYAQGGETAVPFLLLAPDSRAGGMGESGTGLADNSAAIFWNPAGIGFLKGKELSITHSNWLPQFNLDLFYDYLTYRQYVESLNGSITASITYLNFGEFVRTGPDDPTPLGTFNSFDAAITLGYATKISDDMGLGFNFRLIHSRLSDQPVALEQGTGTATSISFDVGWMWRPAEFNIPLLGDLSKKFSLGINLSNLGPKINYIDQAQADPIPTNLRVGMAFQLLHNDFNSLIYTFDMSKLLVVKDSTGAENFYKAIFTSWSKKPVFRSINYSMGVEYTYGIPGDFLFSLRTGFFYEDPSFGNRKFVTFGAGIRYDIYGFDFSYITTSIFKGGANHPLSDTLRFSVAIGWGGTQSTTVGLPRGI